MDSLKIIDENNGVYEAIHGANSTYLELKNKLALCIEIINSIEKEVTSAGVLTSEMQENLLIQEDNRKILEFQIDSHRTKIQETRAVLDHATKVNDLMSIGKRMVYHEKDDLNEVEFAETEGLAIDIPDKAKFDRQLSADREKYWNKTLDLLSLNWNYINSVTTMAKELGLILQRCNKQKRDVLKRIYNERKANV